MLLRRIKHHVVSENWFAVLVDFVIVVVGVYVGIEVSNWNEARQEEGHSREYLERIRADLVQDRQSTLDRRRFWTQVIEYGEAAIRHAETRKLHEDSMDKTLLAYFQASQVDPYATVKTTYDELKAAGDLRLIDNEDLRASLTDYYVNSTSVQAEHLFQYIPAYREYIRGIVPHRIQQFIWTNCHGTEGNLQLLRPCTLPVDDKEAEELLEQIVRDQEIMRGLRFWISNLVVARNVIEDNQLQIDEMIELVDETLAAN